MESSVSYECFIQSYDRLIGLTGTIGSDNQRKELKEIYKFDSFDVPRFEGNAQDANLKILKPIIIKGFDHWITQLCEEIINTSKAGQPVLIILQQQLELIRLYEALKSKIPEQFWDLIQTLEGQEGRETFSFQERIICQAGDIIQKNGRITLGLQIAGRGIDIKPIRQVNSNGGLKVILCFLSWNSADEVQAKGRTCRQTNYGQFMYILEEGRLDERFLAKYQEEYNFEEAVSKFRIQIEQEMKTNRQELRSYNRFLHNISLEFFFQKLNYVKNNLKRKKIAREWQYFLNSLLDTKMPIDVKEQKKMQFFNQQFEQSED